MALPVLTTAEDVRELVRFLKNKPTGATIAEAKAALKKQVLDPRKMTAYTLWGFVTKEGERLKLTPPVDGITRESPKQKPRFSVVRSIRLFRTSRFWNGRTTRSLIPSRTWTWPHTGMNITVMYSERTTTTRSKTTRSASFISVKLRVWVSSLSDAKDRQLASLSTEHN